MKNNEILLEQTRAFWNTNPCDGYSEVSERMLFRYEKEPWLPPILEEIATFRNILEIGCGQGTDALYCCQRMQQGSSYIGVDVSDQSITQARKSLEQVKKSLIIYPHFMVGNAEALKFDDNTFDCVVSLGVLHHTPNLEKALSEIHRVLKPGEGCCILSVYRLLSPKLLGAYAFRSFSRFLDKITFSEHLLLRVFQKNRSRRLVGTMILECLGVPILRSYTRRSLSKKLASDYSNAEIRPVGIGFKLSGLNTYVDNTFQFLGAQYLIKTYKS